jgi:hypothetical protein
MTGFSEIRRWILESLDPPSKIGRKLKNPVGMVFQLRLSNLKAAPTR